MGMSCSFAFVASRSDRLAVAVVAAAGPSASASSAVSGRAMLSRDRPSALTPRKAATIPPAIISAAPM